MEKYQLKNKNLRIVFVRLAINGHTQRRKVYVEKRKIDAMGEEFWQEINISNVDVLSALIFLATQIPNIPEWVKDVDLRLAW